jgi:hypothetical protein
MISALQTLTNSQGIDINKRFWQITTTQGNELKCKIVSFKPADQYIQIERWYGDKVDSAFDLIWINTDHIVWVQLYKEPS